MKAIVDIKGGLGNQMFCYAFAYAVAQINGAELCIDTSLLEGDKVKKRKLELLNYNILFDKKILYKYDSSFFFRKTGINRIRKKCAIGFRTRIYKENEVYNYDKNAIKMSCDTYYDGYWQNYRYFMKYREELIGMFQPIIEKSKDVVALETSILSKESVSLHIRRGDYIGLNWQLPMEYYELALNLLYEKLGVTESHMLDIYFFSDDMDYVRAYFEGKRMKYINFHYMEYSSENRNIFDMYLMSCCKHNIIANSSYSWWGAYLNSNKEKIVICPYKGMWGSGFYPEDWTGIDLNQSSLQ